eukprot:scaffold357_cov239-Pinguiococcus_pyrenoidosus.AAC.1
MLGIRLRVVQVQIEHHLRVAQVRQGQVTAEGKATLVVPPGLAEVPARVVDSCREEARLAPDAGVRCELEGLVAAGQGAVEIPGLKPHLQPALPQQRSGEGVPKLHHGGSRLAPVVRAVCRFHQAVPDGAVDEQRISV